MSLLTLEASSEARQYGEPSIGACQTSSRQRPLVPLRLHGTAPRRHSAQE